ncbi:NAC domain-containing protein 1-like isoform X2 [Magnolia sinica]|uniref:NAC domain-containing protein 1-like isoform X2 n=1 Tax=Magnolia sinica TaxID=86752 RepID=UPI0026584305|nr:NAC domain-containing protein 1-like isoform X2 [Magnolia sinica]
MGDLYSQPFPPGFRFQPTEEELLAHYLRNKHHQRLHLPSHPLLLNAIQDLDIYNHDPVNLPETAYFPSVDEEKRWFFFTPRAEGKQEDGLKRKAKGGYWKRMGGERAVVSVKEGAVLGTKKTFAFYRGTFPQACKTDWVMDEYELADSHSALGKESFALCCVFLKACAGKEKHAPNSHAEYIPAAARNPDVDIPPTQHIGASLYGIGEVVAQEDDMQDELGRFLMAMIDEPDGLLAAHPVDNTVLSVVGILQPDENLVKFSNGLTSDGADDVIDEPIDPAIVEGTWASWLVFVTIPLMMKLCC